MPGYTVMQGGVVTTSDLLEDQRFRARAPEFDADARAAIAAPVGWGERPWGVLGAYASELRDWTEDDIHFVQSMANTIGLAIYRSRAEDALRESSTRLELSLQASGLAAWSWELASDLIDFTPAAVDIYGLDPSTTRLNGDEYLEFVHPDDRTALRGDTFESLQTTGEYNTSYRWVNHARGEVRWLESWGQLVDDSYGNPSRLIGVTADVTERRLAEDTKEALLAAEQRARLEGDRARGRLSLLLEGAALFNASLDPNEILAALPDFCVPRICDVCLVDVIDEHQSLVEAAGAGVSETAIADVRALRARRAQLAGIGGVYSEQRVAQTGQSVLIGHITDEHYRAAASDDDHLALFRRAAVMSSIVVPLVARDRVIGVLSLLNVEDRSGRPFDADDLALVQELADRAALAVDNGRLFESRNRVARSLQAALLPPKLPDIDGLDLAARYQVAEDDIEIGGDFYDVIEMGDRAWGLVIGDVCGRGPEAAALTGLMRHSVRAAVVRQRLPSGVLAQTNAAVIGQIDDSRFCTAAYLRVEVPDDGPVRVVASSAGHPRPVVLRRDGSTETLECSGLLLGVVATPRYVDVEVDLAPGDAVVLYTDGVTEARQGTDLFGEDRMLAALAAQHGRDADGIAAGLVDEVRRYSQDASDDQAILVVRVPER
jgi:PAS domain S-box-containing protein